MLLLGLASPASAAVGDLWYTFLDELALVTGPVTMPQLENQRDRWNTLYVLTKYSPLGLGPAVITYDVSSGRYRLIDDKTGEYITQTNGGYPYVVAEGDVPATAPDTRPNSTNKWLSFTYFPPADVQLIVLSHDVLAETAKQLNDAGTTCSVTVSGDFYVITRTEGRKTLFYCNSAGFPYVASKTPAVADNTQNIIIDVDDNSTTIENQIVDIGDEIFTIIDENGDKITYNIDSLFWDNSTHSYTANTYQYDITNNTYNYYTWNISYNITNTYVTYIGSNQGFQEEYEYYYELPDGRSSADLTADEIAGISFQFADVVNYARSATDTTLRALYHFDGDTDDSGYFSTATEFVWNEGASITYMDSGNFNGALYLDNVNHDFDIRLPSNLGAADWSIQFRYYQASQPDTQTNKENSLSLGSNVLLTWDEQSFYPFGGSTAVQMPVGSWNELAFVKDSGVIRFYLNGIQVASKSDSMSYNDLLSFVLGDTSRQYSMLDELRVVNFPLVTGGLPYTPTSVPFDTNLVLVLPDSAFPIADEYWEFNSEGSILSGYDFSTGAIELPDGWNDPGDVDISFFSDYVQVSNGPVPSWALESVLEESGEYFSLLYSMSMATESSSYQPLPTGSYTYTFSIMTTDGTVYSLPFNFSVVNGLPWDGFSLSMSNQYIDFGGFYLVARRDGFDLELVVLPDNSSVDIVYAECVPGSVANTGHEKVSCIYSSEEVKANTAAIQSDIPVNGYTVGGVRPTFPARGDVWLPVSGSRITGCYIYNGRAWEEVGARWYTGVRWIPIYAFDIYTLQDCWDIADGDDVVTPIGSENEFWNWWKQAWTDFVSGFGSGGSGGESFPGGEEDNPTLPDIPPGDGEDEGFSIFELVAQLLSSIWSLLSGTVSVLFGGVTSLIQGVGSGVNGFFDAMDGSNPGGLFGIVTATEGVW